MKCVGQSLIVFNCLYYRKKSNPATNRNLQQNITRGNNDNDNGNSNPRNSIDLQSQTRYKLQHNVLDIPLKATVISSMSPLPGMFVGLMMNFYPMTLQEEMYLIFLVFLLILSLRMPVIMELTFKQNELNQAMDKQATRERNRQLEILHAMKDRELRKQAWVP